MKIKTKNKAFDTAYQDGYRARMNGKPRSANPYRSSEGGFGPAFHKYWDQGWRKANAMF